MRTIEEILESFDWQIVNAFEKVKYKSDSPEHPDGFRFCEDPEQGDTIAILPYAESAIFCVKLNQDAAVISFGFSGCAMAKFDYLGSTYVAHIYLKGVGHIYDSREKWNNFIRNNNVENISLFYPYSTDIMAKEEAMNIIDPDVQLTVCGVIEGNEYRSHILDTTQKLVCKSAYHAAIIGRNNAIIIANSANIDTEIKAKAKGSCLIV